MKISISDWGSIEQVLPIAMHYQVGLEVQQFAIPENLDQAAMLAPDIRQRVNVIPLIGMHGPYSELAPASREPVGGKPDPASFSAGI